MNLEDSLRPLIMALHNGEAPPMAWVVEWSAGGTRDPVEAAYRAGMFPQDVLDLIWFSLGAPNNGMTFPVWSAAFWAYRRLCVAEKCVAEPHGNPPGFRRCAQCVDAVRAAAEEVNVSPFVSLGQLLASAKQRKK